MLPIEDLEHITTLHDQSDFALIRLATKQTAYAATKEAKSGRLDASELAKVWEHIQSVEARMSSIPFEVPSLTELPSALQFSDPSIFAPFPGKGEE